MGRELASEFVYGMAAELRGSFPNIPLPPDIDLNAFSEDERFFTTLPIMPVGARSRNQRTYSREAVEAIVRQINENRPSGFWGHLPVEERATRYDPPAVRWLAAMIDGDGMAWGKLIATRQDAREHLRFAMKSNARVGTSIYGWAEQDGELVTDIELESIDLADPARVGILEANGVPAVSAEMVAEEQPDMTEAQVAELTAERGQLQEQLASLTARAEAAEGVVGELRGLLGDSADVLAAVRELHGMAAEFKAVKAREITRQIDDAVAEAVSLEALRPLVRLAIGAAETVEAAKAAIQSVVESPHYKDAASKIVQAEMGPSALVPPRAADKPASLDEDPAAIAKARNIHGI